MSELPERIKSISIQLEIMGAAMLDQSSGDDYFLEHGRESLGMSKRVDTMAEEVEELLNERETSKEDP